MTILSYLDSRLLNLYFTLTLFGISIAFYLVYSVYRKPYVKQMAIGYAINGFGTFLIVLRDYTFPFVSVILGNVLVMISLYMIYEAIVKMFQQKSYKSILVAFGLIYIIMQIVLTYVYPSVVMRILLYSLFSFIGNGYVAIFGVKRLYKQFNIAIFIIVITQIFNGVVDVLRSVNGIKSISLQSLFSEGITLNLLFLYSIVISLIRVICVMLYNTKEDLEP